jgi:hypothetical protein
MSAYYKTKILFLLCGFLAIAQAAQEVVPLPAFELTQAQLKALPVMIRHDAQKFCNDIYPVLSRNQQGYDAGTFNHNPYELLMECVVFGLSLIHI